MTPVDWDSDPELKALRDEFIASFAERRRMLASDPDAKNVRWVAHKLAGVAESYGFAILTEASAALDDLLEARVEPDRVARYARLLDRMLEAAERERQDPVAFRADEVFKELICAAE